MALTMIFVYSRFQSLKNLIFTCMLLNNQQYENTWMHEMK